MFKILKKSQNFIYSKKDLKQKEKKILFFISKTNKNTFISCINIDNNNVIGVFSCGSFGFKGRKQETPFALILLTNKVVLFALNLEFKISFLVFKGIGANKKYILRTFKTTETYSNKLQIIFIKDVTQYPYNGCRKIKSKNN